MNYLIAIFFGVVQGLTEMLPVSSSGHLLILHRLIGFDPGNELAFDTTLHLATLLALLFYFRQEVRELFIGWLKSFRGQGGEAGRLAWLVIFATIPAGLAGLWLGDWLESVFRSPLVVAAMLALVGLLFLVIERYRKGQSDISGLKARQAIAIGAAQALALIPGTSRSGITIIAGMFFGLQRAAAARFTFILAMPIIAAAALKEAPKVFSGPEQGDFRLLAISFIAAFIASWLAIRFFLKFTEKFSLRPFAWYRIVVAIAIAILFWR